MVAGGNVERGARGELGERRLAAQLRDGLQQIKRAVDGLDAVAVAVGAAVRPGGLNPGPGDDSCVHGSFLPCAAGESGWPRESSDFPIEEFSFRNMKKARKSPPRPGLLGNSADLRFCQAQLDLEGSAQH